MKVLHISTSDSGGAGLACIRIHNSLLEQGVDSKVLVLESWNRNEKVYIYQIQDWRLRWMQKWRLFYSLFVGPLICRLGIGCRLWGIDNYFISKIPTRYRTLFTSPITDYELSVHPLVKEADVIHLHWISGFLDYRTFFRFVDKPVVWTLHDENIAFGGFHYSYTRERYVIYYKKLEEKYAKIKTAALSGNKNITLVALSQTMEDFCKRHAVTALFPVRLVHNSVSFDVYRMFDKKFSREVLHLPQDKKIFLFVSQDLCDERKGLKDLETALEELDLPDVVLVSIGDAKGLSRNASMICLGRMDDERLLSVAYSSADFFIMTSYQESFGQTSLEAMACGCPVIGYPAGVMPELINIDNGILCTDFSVSSLKAGIMEGLSSQYDRQAVRESIQERFAPSRISREYIKVYETVCARKY